MDLRENASLKLFLISAIFHPDERKSSSTENQMAIKLGQIRFKISQTSMSTNGKYSGQETLFLPKERFAMTLFLPGFFVQEGTSEVSEHCSWGSGGRCKLKFFCFYTQK